jgi:hypothetical protein
VLAVVIILVASAYARTDIDAYLKGDTFRNQQARLVNGLFQRAEGSHAVTYKSAISNHQAIVDAMVDSISHQISSRLLSNFLPSMIDHDTIVRQVEDVLVTDVYGRLIDCTTLYNIALQNPIYAHKLLGEGDPLRVFHEDKVINSNGECHILADVVTSRATLLDLINAPEVQSGWLREFQRINHGARQEAGILIEVQVGAATPIAERQISDFRDYLKHIDTIGEEEQYQVLQEFKVGIYRTIQSKPPQVTSLYELIHSIRLYVAVALGIILRTAIRWFAWLRQRQNPS